MSELPSPLVPADVDLRGFEFMPLFGDRLFKSETWISASADAKVAALRLWWHSYGHEVPAGSLPDNDGLLAEYAGYGVMVKAWKKLKPQAMRGYILCSDGRWYHPLVAELAIDGWKERVRNREKQRAWRERNQQKDRNVTVTDTVTKPVTKPLCHAGEGQGQGEVIVNPTQNSVVSTPPEMGTGTAENATRHGALCRRLRTLGIDCAPHLQAWATLLPAHSDEEIITAANRAREQKPGERIHLNYLVPMLADARQPKARGSPKAAGKQALRADYLRQQGYTGGEDGNSSGERIIDGKAERVA